MARTPEPSQVERLTTRLTLAAMLVTLVAAGGAAIAWDAVHVPSEQNPPAPIAATPPLVASSSDRERAHFAACDGPVRVTCVVDGDTIWYRGDKIRIADINAPEVSEPECAAEARLGAKATRRLTELLNAGPFTLTAVERPRDVYGRRLLVIERGGRSLGDTLEAEGLVEAWRGYRRDWC